MSKPVIGVVRGGASRRYAESLESGRRMLGLIPERFGTKDIFVSLAGEWHSGGVASSPSDILNSVDCVINALHTDPDDCSEAQRIIQQSGIPFTASSAFTCALTSRRALFARHIALNVTDKNHGLYKPSEERRGKDLICAVIDNFRDAEHYATIPAEIRKTDGSTHLVCPSQISEAQKRQIETLAVRAHKLVGARHYSLSYCGVTEEGTPYLDSIDVHPALGEETLFEELLEAVGITARQFVELIIENALEKRRPW